MMQLNKAVCLDYPEANIPWFHEKYIQERKTGRGIHSFVVFFLLYATSFPFVANRKRANYENVFYLQVYETLLEITGNPSFIMKNVDAPYGYFVDFVVALNKRNEITDPCNGVVSTQ